MRAVCGNVDNVVENTHHTSIKNIKICMKTTFKISGATIKSLDINKVTSPLGDLYFYINIERSDQRQCQ